MYKFNTIENREVQIYNFLLLTQSFFETCECEEDITKLETELTRLVHAKADWARRYMKAVGNKK